MSPWIDALSIPKYRAKARASRDRIVSEPRLEKLIKLGIEKSKLAVVIRSKTYLRASWTKMELDHICKKNIPWFQVFRGVAKRKCEESSTCLRKPRDVVDKILELYDIKA